MSFPAGVSNSSDFGDNYSVFDDEIRPAPSVPGSGESGYASSASGSKDSFFPILLKAYEEYPSETIAEIRGKLQRGSNIATQLLDINAAIPIATGDMALSLTWFLMGCAFQENDGVYYRGTARMPMSKEQSTRFKHFYKACKEADAHNRTSSHFKKVTVGHQKGLDFKNGDLPLDEDLMTVLCGRLKDGSFFIKTETEPLSCTKVRSILHLRNWFRHWRSGGGKQVVNGVETRRETDGRKEINQKFRKFEKTLSSAGLEIASSSGPAKYVHQMHRRVSEASLEAKQELSKRKTSAESAEELEKVNEIEAAIDQANDSFEAEMDRQGIKRPEDAFGREVIVNLDYYTSMGVYYDLSS